MCLLTLPDVLIWWLKKCETSPTVTLPVSPMGVLCNASMATASSILVALATRPVTYMSKVNGVLTV